MSHPMVDAAHALFDEAEATLARMRRDAAHLRQIGQRAKVGASLAAQAAKATIERAADETLDRFERAFAALQGKR